MIEAICCVQSGGHETLRFMTCSKWSTLFTE
jgi:hypothetical protein